jgi:hypothetical protein
MVQIVGTNRERADQCLPLTNNRQGLRAANVAIDERGRLLPPATLDLKGC